MKKGEMRKRIEAEKHKIETGMTDHEITMRAFAKAGSRREIRERYERQFVSPQGIEIKKAGFLDEEAIELLEGFVASVNASNVRPMRPMKLRKYRENGSRVMSFERDKSHTVWRTSVRTYLQVRARGELSSREEHIDVFGDGTIRKSPPYSGEFDYIIPGSRSDFWDSSDIYDDNDVSSLPIVVLDDLKQGIAEKLAELGVDWTE